MKPLITEQHRQRQAQLHRDPRYGAGSGAARLVAQVIQQVGTTELLDYGAGKGGLGQTLKSLLAQPLQVRHYEPARPEWAAAPQPAAFVACIEVLEHVEPELLDNVLDDLQRVTVNQGFFSIQTATAPGTPAPAGAEPTILQPSRWWLPRLMSRFELVVFQRVAQGFWVVVEPKGGDPIRQQRASSQADAVTQP